ncbi:MAG: hypothetical protein IT371_30655 [Deltaproteobacteria bacterium]|nr:hypothetical protein [Deltaproteobacteria bacterium]
MPPILRISGVLGGGAPPSFSCTLTGIPATPLEIGAQLINPTFNASYSGVPVAASISDTEGNPPQNVLAVPNPITRPFTYQKNGNGQTVTFTLTANDGGPPAVSNVVYTWLPRVFFGVSALATLTEAQIEALAGSALASSYPRSFTTSPTAQYVYYAWPASFGNATPLSFQTPPPFPGGWVEMAGSPISITANTAGAPTQNYRVWRTVNLLTAVSVLTVVS